MMLLILIVVASLAVGISQFFSSTVSQVSHLLDKDGIKVEHMRHLTNSDPHTRQLQRNLQGKKDTGSVPSDECDTPDGQKCNNDGSSNYANRTLTYDAITGIFEGKFVTNQCNDQYREYGQPVSSCVEQTIPAPFVEQPGATPVLGRIAMTMSGGVNIYSAFEAGFNDCATDQMPCACDGASCPGGMDVLTCESHLYYACTSDVQYKMFMDSCGGHATPYHIHTDPVCNYHTDDNGHSTIVGVSLDGFGIYGKFESGSTQRPCDLDVCHGHVGVVPANAEYGIEGSNGVPVYHYHIQDTETFPYTWTIGCYGAPDKPVNLETCMSLYSQCGDDKTEVMTMRGKKVVDLYCPCYENVIEGC